MYILSFGSQSGISSKPEALECGKETRNGDVGDTCNLLLTNLNLEFRAAKNEPKAHASRGESRVEPGKGLGNQ